MWQRMYPEIFCIQHKKGKSMREMSEGEATKAFREKEKKKSFSLCYVRVLQNTNFLMPEHHRLLQKKFNTFAFRNNFDDVVNGLDIRNPLRVLKI